VAFKKAVSVGPNEPRVHMAIGNFYWSTRRPAEAEKSFLRALALRPADVPTNRVLATFYLTVRRPAMAEKYLKAVADISGELAARIRLADYYLIYNKEKEGIAILTELAKTTEGFAPATTRLAASIYANGSKDEGHRLVKSVLAKYPNDAPAQQLEARFLFLENKPLEAIAQARGAIQSDAQFEAAHYLIAQIQMSLGDVQNAIVELKTVQQLNPRAAMAEIMLAQIQAEAGYPDLAVTLAKSAVVSANGSPDMRLSLVNVLLSTRQLDRAGEELAILNKDYGRTPKVLTANGQLALLKRDFPAARKAFEEALKVDPASIDALTGLAGADIGAGNPAAARARIEAELAKAPDRTGLLLLAAKVYGATREFPKAEAALKKAVDTNPLSIEGYSLLAAFYYQQGRLEDGRREFESLVKRQPKNVGALTMLAIINKRLNRIEEAIQLYETALSLDPEAGVAANNLAWIYVQQGDHLDRAIQLGTVAVQRLPNEAGVADTLGWAYVKRGFASLGLPHLQLEVKRSPQEAMYHYHLGAAYIETKEPLRAKAELEQALKLSNEFEGAADARRLLAGLK